MLITGVAMAVDLYVVDRNVTQKDNLWKSWGLETQQPPQQGKLKPYEPVV